MGVACAPDIFQGKMSQLMQELEYVKTYLDDLLVITNSTYEDHLEKLEVVLDKLRKAGLRVNIAKSNFCAEEIEYLGYVLTREGIKPQPEKVRAILAIKEPSNVKQLRTFLGMVQYYRDITEKRSHLLAPLSDLVGECGITKDTRKKKKKLRSWHWDKIHQDCFDAIKRQMAKDVLLAYPDYSETFEIFTDASTRQLGGVITQRGRPLAFFSRKLTDPQTRYTVTDLELLSIVECLKEFKGMLWGQKIKVYTDHKNLEQDALGSTSDRVCRWRLLLEEFGPEIVYIKGIDNTVADAISRLEYYPSEKEVKDLHYTQRYCYMAKSLTSCVDESSPMDTSRVDDFVQNCFAQVSTGENNDTSEDEIYPVTISEIASEQRRDRKLKKFFKSSNVRSKQRYEKHFAIRVIDGDEVLVYKRHRLVVPAALQSRIIQWYHYYLMHPGQTRLYETLAATMFWPLMESQVRAHTKKCKLCQLGKRRRHKYGHLPPKESEIIPWRCVCVDLIGPYTIKGKDGTILDFMCLTMIDPATAWFEIIELPTKSVLVKRNGDMISEIIIDKTSAQISRLFNKAWLSRYPRSKTVIFDNGSEFKLHFRELCDSFQLRHKPTTVLNPQANAILERVHSVLGDMMRTSALDMSDTVSDEMIDDFLTNAAWAIRSTHHTMLQSSPGAALFGRDMLFDIPYLADWTEIGRRRQELVDRDNERENSRRIEHDYKVGDKCTLRKHGLTRKAEFKSLGPFKITQIFTNGNVRIQRGTTNERVNIRRIDPFFE